MNIVLILIQKKRNKISEVKVEYTYKLMEGNTVYTDEKELVMNFPVITYEKAELEKVVFK
ncbi:MAG: hypothetical protein ACRCSD_09780 [Clostridium sp.]